LFARKTSGSFKTKLSAKSFSSEVKAPFADLNTLVFKLSKMFLLYACFKKKKSKNFFIKWIFIFFLQKELIYLFILFFHLNLH
jgi:hypothetical protein